MKTGTDLIYWKINLSRFFVLGTASAISEHRRIIAFRNILIHGYAEIDHRLVWGMLEGKLPDLHRQVEALLAKDPTT